MIEFAMFTVNNLTREKSIVLVKINDDKGVTDEP